MDNSWRKSKISFSWINGHHRIKHYARVKRRINITRTSVQKWARSGRVKQSTMNWNYAWPGPQHLPLRPIEVKAGPSPGKCKRNWMPSKCRLTNIYYQCLGERKEQMNGCSRSWEPQWCCSNRLPAETEILWSYHEAWWAGENHHSRQSARHARKRKTMYSTALWHRGAGWMQTTSSIPAGRAPW